VIVCGRGGGSFDRGSRGDHCVNTVEVTCRGGAAGRQWVLIQGGGGFNGEKGGSSRHGQRKGFHLNSTPRGSKGSPGGDQRTKTRTSQNKKTWVPPLIVGGWSKMAQKSHLGKIVHAKKKTNKKERSLQRYPRRKTEGVRV